MARSNSRARGPNPANIGNWPSHTRSDGLAGALLDDLLGDVLRDFLVALELHREARAALRGGAEVGRVAEHLAERDERLDRHRFGSRLLALHLPAPPRKVAN